MIDECRKCEDDTRITEREIKGLDMTRDIRQQQEVNPLQKDKKKELEELMKTLGL
ncbi:MAG: hypothetical protein ACP5GJ_02740 [Nanopusillaceae archaeon]